MNKTTQNLETAQTYLDFVKNNLEPLAKHLQVSVEWLWDILVMQARVEAIVYLIVLVSLTVTTVTVSTIFMKNIKKAKWKKDPYDMIGSPMNNAGFVAAITGVLSLILIITSLITAGNTTYTIVTGLVNPEYRAIEKIVEFAKPEVKKIEAEVKQK